MHGSDCGLVLLYWKANNTLFILYHGEQVLVFAVAKVSQSALAAMWTAAGAGVSAVQQEPVMGCSHKIGWDVFLEFNLNAVRRGASFRH